jgi:hypothetical protein
MEEQIDDTNEFDTNDVFERLDELRSVFDRKTVKQDGYLRAFDEFMEENEFVVALHVLCDFLLEPEYSAIEPSLVDKIAEIHRILQLEDYCVELLNSKKSPT